jgi:hypothetical protein
MWLWSSGSWNNILCKVGHLLEQHSAAIFKNSMLNTKEEGFFEMLVILVWLQVCLRIHKSNTFQNLPRLHETADNTECYI